MNQMNNLELQRDSASYFFGILLMVAVYFVFVFPNRELRLLFWKEWFGIVSTLLVVGFVCFSGNYLYQSKFIERYVYYLGISFNLLVSVILMKCFFSLFLKALSLISPR